VANAPLAKLKTALKSDTSDWTTVQNLSKDFVILTAELAMNDPPRGEKAAFERFDEAYPFERMGAPARFAGHAIGHLAIPAPIQ
jgi:hypothetical protein